MSSLQPQAPSQSPEHGSKKSGRQAWVGYSRAQPGCAVFFLSPSLSLIEFEVVVFCFLKKWKRMKLHKHKDVNSLKNLLPF